MAQIDQIQADVDRLLKQVDTLENNQDIQASDVEQMIEDKLVDYPDVSQVPTTKQITIKAVFDDGANADGFRPLSVNAKVYLDNELYKNIALDPSCNWMATVDIPLEAIPNVGATDILTHNYTWVVDETENNFTITFYHEPSYTSIWIDFDCDDEDITTCQVNLLRDNVLCATDSFSISTGGYFDDLIEFNNPTGESGSQLPYFYTPQVDPITDHRISITGNMENGYTIHINKEVGTINLKLDARIRHSSYESDLNKLVFTILRNGSFTDNLAYTSMDDNEYTFEDVPVGVYTIMCANAIGLIRDATLTSGSVTTQTVVIDYQREANVILVLDYENENYTPPDPYAERIDIPVTVTWDDAGNSDGLRPSSVTISLLAGGSVATSHSVTASDGWRYTFTDLPKYEDGSLITYSISSSAVTNYIGSVSGYTATYTYNQKKTRASIKILWDDNNDSRGLRPSQVKATLSNGMFAYPSNTNNWLVYITDIPKYSEGSEIQYSWSIDEVQNYVLYDVTHDGFDYTYTLKYFDRPSEPL